MNGEQGFFKAQCLTVLINPMLKQACPVMALLFLLFCDSSVSLSNETLSDNSKYIEVPVEYSTIQEAFQAAVEGDTILVAPGLYFGPIDLVGKSVVLGSWFLTTQDTSYIGQTILDGNGGSAVITIANSDSTLIAGFTIRNAEDGISPRAMFDIVHCRIINCSDGIDYEEGSGGLCKSNVFENNSDDGIDLDNEVDIVIKENIIRNNGDDGIEVRLQPYVGPILSYIIRNNQIYGNEEDGIQLISYDTSTSRVFVIEGNLIYNNAMVGLGCMGGQVSNENFEGAAIPERIFLFNNTFSGNPYGVTGGDSLVSLNNVFVSHTETAMKNVNAGSIVAHGLYWQNSQDFENCNVDSTSIQSADPRLDNQYIPGPMSPAIDAGTASFIWEGEIVLDRHPDSYSGTAPDLGAFETDEDQLPTPQINGWIPLESGSSMTLNSVFFLDKNTGWVVGDQGLILKTLDGGNSWSSQESGTQNDLSSVNFVNDSTGWAVGHDIYQRDGTVLKTINGGETWSTQLTGISAGLYSAQFIDDSTGWTVGFGDILKTGDGGNNWEGIGSIDWFFSVHFVNADTGWVVGHLGKIYKTTNGGTSWVDQSVSSSYSLKSGFFIDSKTGWIVGDPFDDSPLAKSTSSILKTSDGGDTWNGQSAIGYFLESVFFVDSNTGWAAGVDGVILNTQDGGENWSIQTSGTTELLASLYFVDDTTGWVVGAGGTILKTSTGGAIVTSLHEPKPVPEVFWLGQNYPNPFNPSTTITYSISKPHFVELRIYDLLGKEIQTLINQYQPADTYSKMFDATELPSGVYFFTLQLDGQFSETRKMVFLR